MDRGPLRLLWFATVLTTLLFFLSSATAGERVPVLVSALQARNEESVELAALIEGFVAEKLAKRPELRLLRIEDSADFDDYSARVYIESCPPGEIVGCTFVIGERVEALWAVTGSVKSLVKGTTVDIDIVDVKGSRVAVSFRSELTGGRDEAFAEGVARVLVAAVAGEVGREEDIRKKDADAPTDPQDDEAVAAELAVLEEEMGGFTTDLRRSDVPIERPKLTEADIAEKSEEEGSKPWERLGMSPADYLRYKNSTLDLPTWRQRAEGRRFQVLLRAGGGFINGPVNVDYYGRYAVQGVQTVDAYAAQSVETGSSGLGVVAVGFGVHPMVDVSVQFGVAGGSFSYVISQEVVDSPTNVVPDPTVQGHSSILVGPRVTIAPLPAGAVRPTFGLGAYYLRGSGIDSVVLPPDELAAFGAQPLWNVEVFGGGEARVGSNLDFWLQIPVSFLVSGDRVLEERATTVASLEGLKTPTGASAIGVAVVAGVQVRLFGSKPREASQLDETDEP